VETDRRGITRTLPSKGSQAEYTAPLERHVKQRFPRGGRGRDPEISRTLALASAASTLAPRGKIIKRSQERCSKRIARRRSEGWPASRQSAARRKEGDLDGRRKVQIGERQEQVRALRGASFYISRSENALSVRSRPARSVLVSRSFRGVLSPFPPPRAVVFFISIPRVYIVSPVVERHL